MKLTTSLEICCHTTYSLWTTVCMQFVVVLLLVLPYGPRYKRSHYRLYPVCLPLHVDLSDVCA